MTSATGTNAGTQEFDPWGKVRSGGTIGTQTKVNYTGQQLDATGLLNYNARLYDPTVGRFVSPDSIVPGASSGVGGAGGTVGAEQNSKLTVDFHESEFATLAARENSQVLQQGFGFQTNAGSSYTAPDDPQALNRYSYVLNNPLRYLDPTGHKTLHLKTGTLNNGVVGASAFISNWNAQVTTIMGEYGAVSGGVAVVTAFIPVAGPFVAAVVVAGTTAVGVAMAGDLNRVSTLLGYAIDQANALTAIGVDATIDFHFDEGTGKLTIQAVDPSGKCSFAPWVYDGNTILPSKIYEYLTNAADSMYRDVHDGVSTSEE